MTARINRPLLLACCAAPIVIFLWAVFAMSTNTPFQDDFDALLEPVLLLHSQDFSWAAFWQALYQQDDERRIVVDRLIAYLLYTFNGELNLKLMVIGGALNLLIVPAVLYRWFKSTATSLVLMVPIVWALFNIQFYETIFWAMIPFQHLAVFVWAILTMWLLTRGTRATLLGALATGLLTIYADVSGNFILPAGLLALAAQYRWREAAIWLLVLGIVAGFYFTGLEMPAYRPKFSDNFSNPLQIVLVLITLFGIWADPGPTFPMLFREGLSLVLGLAGLIFVLQLLVKEVKNTVVRKNTLNKDSAFLWGTLGFITIVLLVLASGRASEGLETFFNPRYRHMYLFWIIFSYLLAVRYNPVWFRSSVVQSTLVAGSVLFCANAYLMYWGGLDKYRKTFLIDAYQWYHNRSLPSSPIYLSLRKRVDDIYEGVYKQGIYHPEKYPFETLPEAPVEGRIEVALHQADGGVDVSVANVARGMGKNDGAYLIFRADNGETHILPTYHRQRPLHRLLLDGSYYYPDAQMDRYATDYFKSKAFEVEVGIIEGKKQYRLITGKQLRL